MVVPQMRWCLAADREKLFESHDLVVEFHGELRQDSVAILRIRRILRQLFDFLGNSGHFRTIVLIIE